VTGKVSGGWSLHDSGAVARGMKLITWWSWWWLIAMMCCTPEVVSDPEIDTVVEVMGGTTIAKEVVSVAPIPLLHD